MILIYLEIALKLAIGLIAFIIVLRTTGRGQLNNMTPLDLIGNFVLGGIIGGVIYNKDISVLKFIIVLAIWEILIILVNFLRKHSNFLRAIIVGKTVPVIVNGKFQLSKFIELGIDISDFVTLLRMQGVSLHEVSYAQIESNNQVSVIRKDDHKNLAFLIKKGEIDKDALDLIKRDENWLKEQLKKQNFKGEIEDIYFAEWLTIIDDKGNIIKGDLYIVADENKLKKENKMYKSRPDETDYLKK